MLVMSPQLQSLLLRIATFRLGSREERGASAVEYGLMVAGIAAVIVGVVFIFGQGILNNLFQNTCNSIGQNMGGCGTN
jgi:pilus assembly protein Flp/PilA